MKLLLSTALVATLAAAAPAQAVTGGGALSEGVFAGVSVTEAPGSYTLVNGSVSAVVYGFGVTNPDSTLACIGACGDGFGPYQDTGFLSINGGGSGEFWGAISLTQDDWSTYVPNTADLVGEFGATMEDLFGAWAWSPTEKVNWYDMFDASGVGAGSTATGFNFFAPVASDAFGLGSDSTGNVGYFDLGDITATADVPLPAAAWMLIAGLGAMGVAARRKA
ncbi:VPLPA-CTERM sorting domain-containing protein [Rhodovulum sp. DZ06]|uniref:VPLPA-CTERM sorting domain-containing protein n=1 Tax=Rhodovulum sp. DZ06 TaxID=3425126 RepID=UPI003D33AB0D